ncbi:MAG: hypothetical protein IMY80_07615 [Chloroflexi bacterium]|nr:hypothetical protein [Chloroflexota bacterium]
MAENADFKVVCHKIDDLGRKFDKLEIKLDTNIEVSSGRLRELEKQTAVMENGMQAICKDVDGLQEKSNRNDVFVVVGNLIVVATASVASYLGLRE